MHVFARVSAAAAALVTALSGTALPAPAPTDVVQQGDGSPQVAFGVADGQYQIGTDLELVLSIENDTSDDLRDATAELSLTYVTIDTRFALDAWLEGEPVLGERPVATIEVPDVARESSSVAEVVVSAEQLGFSEQSIAGAYGMRLTVGGVTTSSVLTVGGPSSTAITSLSIAAPITTPPDPSGLLSREQLTALTSNVGSLERQLRTVEQYPISVGIDPMIETSVYAEAQNAPAGAWDWVERVSALEYPFHTSYATSDVLGQLAAGLDPLDPLGYPDETAIDGISDVLPRMLSSRGVVNASERVLDAELLAAVDNYGVPFITTAQLDEGLATPTPSAAVTVDGVPALAADQDLQRTINAAISGETAADRIAATSELIALLATISREAPNSVRALAAMIDPSARGAEELLQILDASDWVELAPIETALEAPPREVELLDIEADELDVALLEAAESVHEQDALVERYSEIAEDPRSIRVPYRLSALAALHVTSTTTGPAVDRQVRTVKDLADDLLDSVRILPGSPIQIVGSSVQLPVELVNELDEAVTVTVHLRTRSLIVLVEDPLTEVTVAAGSTQRVLMPVEVIGSGSTTAIVTLQTADGEEISEAVTLRVEAQPEIETVLLWLGAVSVFLLVGFGFWRSLRKRRQGKATGDLDGAELSRRARPRETGAS